MRRDYFTLDVRGLEWTDTDDGPTKPTLVIDFEGPASLLRNRVTDDGENLLEASDIDVTFRFQTPVEDDDASGVISVTDRLTGDYVLELNAPGEAIFSFVRAAREYGDRSGDDAVRYGIEIRIDGDGVATYDKKTFLVYTNSGKLLREQSLIPSGVEL